MTQPDSISVYEDTHIVEVQFTDPTYDTITVTNDFWNGFPVNTVDHFVIGKSARSKLRQITHMPIEARLTFIDGFVMGIEFI